MEHPVSMNLYQYWKCDQGGTRRPDRNAIDPGAIRGILADTFVLDFENHDGFPFRIAGSRANALFLTELRGLSFLELWRETDRQEIRSILYRVAGEAQPFCLGAEAQPPGLDRLDIEATLLPLRHHGSTYLRVLGSLACGSTAHSARPRRRRSDDADLPPRARAFAVGRRSASQEAFRRPGTGPTRDARRRFPRQPGPLRRRAGALAPSGLEPGLGFRPVKSRTKQISSSTPTNGPMKARFD